jgi:hypothetical protein
MPHKRWWAAACGAGCRLWRRGGEAGRGRSQQVEVFSWWTGGGEAKGLEAMIADFKQKKSPIEFVNAAVAGGSGTNAKAVLAGCQGPPSLRTTGLPAGLAGAATSAVTGTPPLKADDDRRSVRYCQSRSASWRPHRLDPETPWQLTGWRPPMCRICSSDDGRPLEHVLGPEQIWRAWSSVS